MSSGIGHKRHRHKPGMRKRHAQEWRLGWQSWKKAGEYQTFRQLIQGSFEGEEQDIRTYSPLTLAYIGDAVYDLIIRTVVVERANRPANELHRITVRFVSAGAQAAIGCCADGAFDRGRKGNIPEREECQAPYHSKKCHGGRIYEGNRAGGCDRVSVSDRPDGKSPFSGETGN